MQADESKPPAGRRLMLPRCDSGSGTNVSSEKLYRILSAQKKEKPRASDRSSLSFVHVCTCCQHVNVHTSMHAAFTQGADEPASISPNVYMRKRSTGTGRFC